MPRRKRNSARRQTNGKTSTPSQQHDRKSLFALLQSCWISDWLSRAKRNIQFTANAIMRFMGFEISSHSYKTKIIQKIVQQTVTKINKNKNDQYHPKTNNIQDHKWGRCPYSSKSRGQHEASQNQLQTKIKSRFGKVSQYHLETSQNQQQ